jgi:hypothetical protein
VKHFLLLYDLESDYLERRGEFRAEHLRNAWASVGRGELVLGGALSDPADGAVLLFKGDTARGGSLPRAGSLREERSGRALARARVDHGRG